MFSLIDYLLLALALCSAAIAYQDFKYRLVSLWLLVLFAGGCTASVLLSRNVSTLLFNTLSALVYTGFTWLMLKLYLYVKFKRNVKILDEQIGAADVLVMISIGLTLNLPAMVFFFCGAFICSLVVFLSYSQFVNSNEKKGVPLAGLLVIFYFFVIILLKVLPPFSVLDCSFVSL